MRPQWGAMAVVVAEEEGEGGGSVAGVGVRSSVGPLAFTGLDEALGLFHWCEACRGRVRMCLTRRLAITPRNALDT